MNEEWKAFWLLVLTGGLIGVAKLLASDEKLTWRLLIGRTILGSATTLIAGVILLQIPNIAPLALLGIGSAFGIAGAQAVELFLKKWFGGAGGAA
ncbi:holin [Dyella japonica DSM 16301]|uniref:Holin n=2 Tax=Dyella japonica TaxID=231455 RepID=A0A0G9H857_9GAMM|nr:holin [Dyella japonica DSM 16301]